MIGFRLFEAFAKEGRCVRHRPVLCATEMVRSAEQLGAFRDPAG